MSNLACRYDYLEFTFDFSSKVVLQKALTRLSFFCSDEVYYPAHGFFSGIFWKYSFASVLGFRGGYNWDSDRECYRGVCFIGGEWINYLSTSQRYQLVKWLNRCQVNWTRFDIALDDYAQRVFFDVVNNVGNEGRYRFFRSYRLISSKVSRSSPSCLTPYFGSPKSDKQLRFYDAELLHDIPAHRWELQLRRNYAETAISEYLADPSCLSSILVGSVDFIETNDVSTWRHYKTCDWWQSIRDEVSNPDKKLPSQEHLMTLDKTLEWLQKQVAPSLAILSEGLESESFFNFVNLLVDSGKDRFKDEHRRLVDVLKKFPDSVILNK